MSQRIKATKVAKSAVAVDTTTDGNNFVAEETFTVELFTPINIGRTLPQGTLYSTGEVEQIWETPSADGKGKAVQTTAVHSGVIISQQAVAAKFGDVEFVPPSTKIVVKPFIQGEDSKSSGKGKGKARLQFVKFA